MKVAFPDDADESESGGPPEIKRSGSYIGDDDASSARAYVTISQVSGGDLSTLLQ